MSEDTAETRLDLTVPAGTLQCGDCGTPYVSVGGAVTPAMLEALVPAAEVSGWVRDGNAWTCSACLARPDVPAAPEPDPAAAVYDAGPDHYDQYLTWREQVAGLTAPEAGTDQSNARTAHKIRLRCEDSLAAMRVLLTTAPPQPERSAELSAALRQGATGLTQQLAGMRRDAAEWQAWCEEQARAGTERAA